MSINKPDLVLSLRSRTLSGTVGGKRINITVKPGSGLLAQVKPGRYTVEKPVNDPSVGWIASVRPQVQDKSPTQAIKADSAAYASPRFANSQPSKMAESAPRSVKWAQSSPPSVKLGQPIPPGDLGDGISFIMTTSSMGGWNDLVLQRGGDVMARLGDAQSVELQVV